MKVFISSVIEGFEDERKTAKIAVESLSMEPVMAEGFSAKPFSSQVACLEGVRRSGIYVGILGARYGEVTTGGVSVTEEEFNEARKRGIPVLWFVMSCSREPKQEEFLKRIADYEGGYFIAFFNSEKDLLPKIVQGLDERRREMEEGSINAKEASRLRNGYISELKRLEVMEPILGAIVFPSERREAILSAVDLDGREMRDQMKRAALFGKSAVFDPQRGTKELEGREYISFVQTGLGEQVTNALSFDVYGALIWGAKVGGDLNENSFLFDAFVIDEQEVERNLISFANCAQKFYDDVVRIPAVPPLYLSVVMLGLENKKFGKRPNVPPTSMGIGFGGMEDPLVVPREPMRVTQGRLRTPEKLVHELVTMISRAFKAEGLYYE